MTDAGTLWPLWIACGAVTFLIRYSFIGAEGRLGLPHGFRRLLPYVPVAALTALVAPDVFLIGGTFVAGIDNPRLWAAVVAVAVAARWRNTLLTIGAGFAVFALLRTLGQ